MIRKLFTAALVGLTCWGGGCATQKVSASTTVIKYVKADEAAQLIAAHQVTVLDIRTPKEFASKHIAGATNLDFFAGDFTAQLARLDRDKIYLLHCASGNRSRRALPAFEQLGFKEIIHLDGGIIAWEVKGHPVAQ